MLIGGVVDDQVHDDLDAALVGAGQQLVEIGHGAELFHDLLIVGDVVAVVVVGGAVDGAHPDDVDAQFLQIVQLADDTAQIADAIAVAVTEGAGVNLIDNTFFPPSLLHFMILLKVKKL